MPARVAPVTSLANVFERAYRASASTHQLIELGRDGFAAFFEVLDAATIATMREEIALRLEDARTDPLWHSGGTLHLELPMDEDSPFSPAWRAEPIRIAIAHLLDDRAAVTRVSYRAPLSGGGAQSLHRDWIEAGKPGTYRVATLIVALSAFTPTNGATRVVPATQHIPGVDRLRDADVAHPRQQLLTGAAGTIFVLNGHIWHSGTRNNAAQSRDSLQVVFARHPE